MRIVFILIYARGAQPSLSGPPLTLIISNINMSLYGKRPRTHHTLTVNNIYLSNIDYVKI